MSFGVMALLNNISKGLIPYKDFNMIVTPMYSFIGGIFVKMIGKLFVFYTYT